jgi:hypothetical protein
MVMKQKFRTIISENFQKINDPSPKSVVQEHQR